MAYKIYLSPAAHGHDNPCSYSGSCGENVHCNLYMDELVPYLQAAGFDVKRNPADRTGDRLKEAIAESNAWGADLHYVAHTNAGGGSHSKLMVYSKGSRAYGYAEALAAQRRAYFAAEGKPWAVKLTVEPQWAELCQTAAPAIYDELVFHDHAEQIGWFHAHLRGMAEATAKGICAMFGVGFADPYKTEGDVEIMGKMVDAAALKAWIDANAVEVSNGSSGGSGESSGSPGGEVGSGGSSGGSEAPALRVGAVVQYSGRLYATSAGGGAGATVSGKYTVSRILSGKSHGVLLDGGLGWVRPEDCTVVG